MERSNPAHQGLSGRSPALSSRSNPRMRSACFVASHSFAAFLVSGTRSRFRRRLRRTPAWSYPPRPGLLARRCHRPGTDRSSMRATCFNTAGYVTVPPAGFEPATHGSAHRPPSAGSTSPVSIRGGRGVRWRAPGRAPKQLARVGVPLAARRRAALPRFSVSPVRIPWRDRRRARRPTLGP